VNSDLTVCTPGDAAVLLYPAVSGIVNDVIIPLATKRDPQRTGGWFTLWRHDPHVMEVVPVIGFAVGSVSADRFQKYMHFANEKAARLADRLTDISSWQSHDESVQDHMGRKYVYGGAIRCKYGLIFSFSGFSEHEDEMICALVANSFSFISRPMIADIMRASNNEPLKNYFKLSS